MITKELEGIIKRYKELHGLKRNFREFFEREDYAKFSRSITLASPHFGDSLQIGGCGAFPSILTGADRAHIYQENHQYIIDELRALGITYGSPETQGTQTRTPFILGSERELILGEPSEDIEDFLNNRYTSIIKGPGEKIDARIIAEKQLIPGGVYLARESATFPQIAQGQLYDPGTNVLYSYFLERKN